MARPSCERASVALCRPPGPGCYCPLPLCTRFELAQPAYRSGLGLGCRCRSGGMAALTLRRPARPPAAPPVQMPSCPEPAVLWPRLPAPGSTVQAEADRALAGWLFGDGEGSWRAEATH